MEIRKILYVLLMGVVLCLIFFGILKCVESMKKGDEGVNQPTASPYVQENNVPMERPTNEPAIHVMQKTEETTMEPAEEYTEEIAKESNEATVEPDVQRTALPVATEAPIMVSPSESPQTQEEVLTAENTPIPVSPTKAPQETQAPLSQSTQQPMPTKVPSNEEIHIHEFEKAVWELPTCQKGGYYNNICKTCGFEESVTQEPLPHQVEDVMIQEGNCMEDRVIRHICTECEIQVGSDTRYPIYDLHQWGIEEVDGVLVEYCERCGVVK